MKKIIVLGAGLVGSAIAIDLKKQHDVTSADASAESLKKPAVHGIPTVQADLSNPEKLKELVKDCDLVIGALPGFLGYNALRACIEAGKNVVDISFFPEDAFGLDELAKQHKVTAVVDCGVAPGMGNIIFGHHHKHQKINSFRCLVGGLPQVRQWPWEYRAVFSPIDVIEEYIRPARYVEGGRLVTREALSDPELIDFQGVGTLEAFNTDGLRSLIHTMPDVPDMIEKTLRYPGCIEYLRVLRAGGFFSYDEVEVKGQKIRPVDLTARLLFPQWKLQPGEGDFTIMRISLGTDSGNITYDLLDRYDPATDTISMARTTGYTCTAVANLVLDGKYDRKGISPPEYVGEVDGALEFVLGYLGERGVVYRKTKS
ncbi:MAG: saccharopine dehydrogenase NADP-binding domain-containing protein [Bacteroidetes bacterium]|nr:saccharopine dehydrogenase NADP-binding domain-containing protein [Bacteroidota bacterium]